MNGVLFSGLRRAGASMNVLLFCVLLTHLAAYLVIPLLPIYLKADKELTAAGIGMVMAVAPVTFQIASLAGGWLAARIGRRTVIAFGYLTNGAGFAGYALAEPVWLLMAAGLIHGTGLGLHAPAIKAAIAALAEKNGEDLDAFSLRGIAANLGVAAGGALSYFVLGGASDPIFYAAAGLFALLGLLAATALPGRGKEPQQPAFLLKTYRDIFRNKPFVVFSLASILIWALYFQLTLSLPLRAASVLPDPGAVSLIWTVNSITVIFFQTWVTRLVAERIHPMYALAAGVLFIGAGLGSLMWAAGFAGLLICGVIFIIGEMLIMPTMDTAVARLGTAAMAGSFFGLANFVSGIGEGAGKLAGGQLLNLGPDSPVPWVAYMLAAVVISLLLTALRYWKPMRAVLPASRPGFPRGGNEGIYPSGGNHAALQAGLKGRNRGRVK